MSELTEDNRFKRARPVFTGGQLLAMMHAWATVTEVFANLEEKSIVTDIVDAVSVGPRFTVQGSPPWAGVIPARFHITMPRLADEWERPEWLEEGEAAPIWCVCLELCNSVVGWVHGDSLADCVQTMVLAMGWHRLEAWKRAVADVHKLGAPVPSLAMSVTHEARDYFAKELEIAQRSPGVRHVGWSYGQDFEELDMALNEEGANGES